MGVGGRFGSLLGGKVGGEVGSILGGKVGGAVGAQDTGVGPLGTGLGQPLPDGGT